MTRLPVLLFATAVIAPAQIGRILDWPTFANDPQRTGWEKSDSRFTKDDLAKTFQLLWKRKLGSPRLTPPVIVGTLVGSRGFKELAFTAGADDSIYVMDVDLDRVYWQKHLDYKADQRKASPTATCPGTTAMPTLLPIVFRRPAPRPAAARPGAAGGIAAPARPTPNPVFAVRSVYVIANDGNLHKLNVDSGNESGQPTPVVPPNSNVSTLNINESVIYATTNHGCGGAPKALWSIDISNPEEDALPKVTSWTSTSGDFMGVGGPVIGTEGTIYVQTASALTAVKPKILEPSGSYLAPMADVTPVIASYKGNDILIAAAKNNHLVILDSKSLSTPLAETPAANEIWGALATWADTDETRWVLATTPGPKGSITAYRLDDNNGKPVLKQAWTSSELMHPTPPVIANGVVFALANGEGKTPATLYALDAATGKEMWSSGNQVTAAGAMTGLTIANGRVYFGTVDGTMWAFGTPLEW